MQQTRKRQRLFGLIHRYNLNKTTNSNAEKRVGVLPEAQGEGRQKVCISSFKISKASEARDASDTTSKGSLRKRLPALCL